MTLVEWFPYPVTPQSVDRESTDVPAVDQVLRLLYPWADVSQLRDAVPEWLIDGAGLDLRYLRRVLNALDRQVYPSPVTVRFGPEDVVRHEYEDGMVIFLDKDDRSVSRPMLEGILHEPHVTAVLRRYLTPGMTVVDVGANIGYFTMLASRLVGPSGRVVAVEPNSENCRLILLSANANKADNVELLPLALDRVRGWSYFTTAIGSNGNFQFGDLPDFMDGHGLVVPTFPLDELIDGPIHLMKLDVEGAEGRAVAGARTLIEKWRPIVISEFSLEMLDRVSSVSGAEYLRWFEDRGYSISVLNRETGTPGPSVSSEDLLASWPWRGHIEDLLLRPSVK